MNSNFRKRAKDIVGSEDRPATAPLTPVVAALGDRIKDLRFWPARDSGNGFVGFLSFRHGAFIFDGVTLHETVCGEYAISFPKRIDRQGIAHSHVRPVHPAVREALTRQIVDELRERKEIE